MLFIRTKFKHHTQYIDNNLSEIHKWNTIGLLTPEDVGGEDTPTISTHSDVLSGLLSPVIPTMFDGCSAHKSSYVCRSRV